MDGPSFAQRRGAVRAGVLVLSAAVLLGASGGVRAQSSGELLDPSQAFRLSAAALDTQHVQIRFRIAKGYYLYRARFHFESATGKPLGGAEFPPGDIKSDPFFGRSEIYRDEVRIELPLPGVDLAGHGVKLKVVSQGCADVGVCYMPQEQWVIVRYAPAASRGVSTLPDVSRGAAEPLAPFDSLLRGSVGHTALPDAPRQKANP